MTDSRTFRTVPFLNLPAQYAPLREKIQARIDRIFEHCGFVMGPEVAAFEKALCAYTDAEHAVGVSSGTDALLILLMAENIGPGDAVFLPAFTYTATAEVAQLLGATPVFVDIDPETFQISPQSLAERIDAVQRHGEIKPRAIIGVDLFGQPAPWEELREIARKSGLLLFADCAQAFGAVLNGRRLGREALATALSFFPSKPLGGAGDAGAILTDDPQRAALYASLRSHGEGKTRYEVLRTGLNARLDSIQAAVLLTRLEVFESDKTKREAVARFYDAHLPPEIIRPRRVPESESVWAAYCIKLPNARVRDSLRQALVKAGIGCAVYYPAPLHRQPAYQKAHDGASLPNAEGICGRVLALPLHPALCPEDLAYVADAISAWRTENRELLEIAA